MNNKHRLGDLFDLVGGGTPSTKEEKYWGDGTPWISSADIDLKGNVLFRKYVTCEGIAESATNPVPANTLIVVTRVGLGKIAVAPTEMCFSQDMQALIPKSEAKFDIKYLLYQMLFVMSRKKYDGQGTTISGITKKQLSDCIITMPPIETQMQVVSHIDELFSELDRAEETLNTTKSQLEVYRQAVLKRAFDGEYTPDIEMREITMDELSDGKEGLRRGPFGSAIKKAFFVESGYKVYEQGNAINDDAKRGTYYISREKYDELSGFHIGAGDFIVSCSGTIGRIAQLPADAEPGVINQALMRIRLKKNAIDTRFFLLQFKSQVFQRKIISRGSGMSNLAGVKEFRQVTMKIPVNYDDQIRIIEEAEGRLSVCDSIESTVDTAILQGKALRQSILKKAFEGGI